MASTNLEVIPPPEPSVLKSLTNSTRSVFELLRPWYKLDPNYTSPALLSIRKEAKSYMMALETSVGAAMKGNAIADEALCFARSINSTHLTSEEAKRSYLQGMHSMAKDGSKNAEHAAECFRDVRKKVARLIEDARTELADGDRGDAVKAKLDTLNGGISTLGSFQDCISLYVSWWTQAIMRHSAQSERSNPAIMHYNQHRVEDIIRKWEVAKDDYLEYINTIGLIRDTEPAFADKYLPQNSNENHLQRLYEQPLDFRDSVDAARAGSPASSQSDIQMSSNPVQMTPSKQSLCDPTKRSQESSPELRPTGESDTIEMASQIGSSSDIQVGDADERQWEAEELSRSIPDKSDDDQGTEQNEEIDHHQDGAGEQTSSGETHQLQSPPKVLSTSSQGQPEILQHDIREQRSWQEKATEGGEFKMVTNNSTGPKGSGKESWWRKLICCTIQ